MKRIFTTVLPILLVLCMLFSSCVSTTPTNDETGTHSQDTEGNTTQTSDPNEGKEPEGTQPPEDPENPDTPTPTVCSHTQTSLKNDRAATCSTEGYTGDTVCDACGTVVTKGTTLEMTSHTWDEGKVTKEPTCISTGLKTITCNGCGATQTETLAQVSHSEEYHDQLDGTHSITCSTCTLSDNAAHTKAGEGIYNSATCTEAAYTLYTCADCQASYKEYSTTELATDHKWNTDDESAWTVVPATCVKDGYRYMTCANGCGEHSVPVTLYATTEAHRYEIFVEQKDADCLNDGYVTYKCVYCEAPKTETLTKLGHNYVTEESLAEDGWTYQVCSRCNDKISHYDASKDKQASVSTDKLESDKAFGVQLSTAGIQFPATVIEQMKQTAGDAEVSIKADVVDENTKTDLISKAESGSTLDEDDIAALKNANTAIYDFGVQVVGTDNSVSQFNANVTVTLSYTLQVIDDEGNLEDPEGIVIWFVNDRTGEVEKITNVIFRDEDGDGTGEVTFEVAHFSCYAVAYRETPAMRCRRGKHEFSVPLTEESRTVSCYSMGYDTYKCLHCDERTQSNIKAPLTHQWGAETKPVVDCANGGYVYQVCQNDGCGAVKYLTTYIRALGHKIDAPATCDTASVCTVCGEVVTPAKGHAWTEWETVVEPTDINPGLRRRYCLRCGKVDEVRLAATGNITEWEFTSYTELVETIFGELFGFGNGTMSFSFIMEGYLVDVDVTVNEENGSYLMLLDAKVDYDGEVQSAQLIYRNGVLIASNATETDLFDLEALIPFTLEAMLECAEQLFDYYNPYAEMMLSELRTMLDEYVSLYGADINAVLAAAGSTYTVEQLATVLDAAETVYTYLAYKMGYQTNLAIHEGVRIPTKSDWNIFFGAFMNATETENGTVYALDIEPVMNAIDATVTWFEEHLDKNMAEIAYEVIIAMLGEEFTEAYPDLTDWDKLFAHFTQTYHGELLVKEFVDKLVSAVEASEVITMAELYELIDQMLYEYVGEEIDSEAIVTEYSNLTVDELLQLLTETEEAKLADLYAAIDDLLKDTVFGDLIISMPETNEPGPDVPPMDTAPDYDTPAYGESVNGGTASDGTSSGEIIFDKNVSLASENIGTELKPDVEIDSDYSTDIETGENVEGGEVEGNDGEAEDNSVTVAMLVEQIRMIFDSIKLEASFSITLDEKGNLIALDIGQVFGMVGEGENGETLEQTIESFEFTITHDDSVKVEIPDNLKDYAAQDPTFTYDENGNLIIGGLNPDLTYEFELNGWGHVDYSKFVKINEELTEKYGFTIYELDEKLWTNTQQVASYYIGADGKYYELSTEVVPGGYYITDYVKLSDLMANPAAYLPKDGTETHDYVQFEDQVDAEGNPLTAPVYQTVVGPVYQLDGVWYLIDEDQSYYSSGWTSGWDDNDEYYEYSSKCYYSVVSAPYTEAVSSMVITSFKERWFGYEVIDGSVQIDRYYDGFIAMDGFEGEVEVQLHIVGDTIYVFDFVYQNSVTKTVVGAEVTELPAHDDISIWTSSTNCIVLPDGTETSGSYQRAVLYVKIPTYYAIYDGQFFTLSDSFMGLMLLYNEALSTSAGMPIRETVTLPDEREFHVVGTTAYGRYDEVVYGYFVTEDGLYVQAACLYSMGELEDIVYRNSFDGTNRRVSFYELFNVNDYLTKNADGTYTVSAKLFEEARAYLNETGDMYMLYIDGRAANGDHRTYAMYYAAGEMVSTNLVEWMYGNMDDSEDISLPWSNWFGHSTSYPGKPSYSFEIVVNDDGSISILVDEEEIVNYNVSIKDGEALQKAESEILEYDEQKSKETGLDVYKAEDYSSYQGAYILKDGAYYGYWEDYEYLYEIDREFTLNGMLSDFTIRDIYLNYYDMDADQAPVYRMSISFGGVDSDNWYEELYCHIEDGRFYVLTGVEDMGESGIKYESQMLIGEYLASLTFVSKNNEIPEGETVESVYGTTDDYLSDGVTPVYFDWVTVYEGEKAVGQFRVAFYFKNGEKQYVDLGDYTTRFEVVLNGDPTVLPDTWQEMYRTTITGTNGTFTRVYGSYMTHTTEYYVSLAGEYYRLDTVLDWQITEDEFEFGEEEKMYVYVVENKDGSLTAYTEWYDVDGNGLLELKGGVYFASLEEMIEKYKFDKCSDIKDLGKSENGEVVYEYILTSTSNLMTFQCSDGTVFYYTENDSYGYLKMPNGNYIEGWLYEDKDGGYYVRLDIRSFSLNSADLLYHLGLLDCLTVNGNKLTISADVTEVLKAYGDSVYIEIRGYVYGDGAVEVNYYGNFYFSEIPSLTD